MSRVVVTPRSLTSPAHPLLDDIRRAGYEVVMPSPGRQPEESELIATLSDAVGYIAGVERIPRAVFEAAPHLRVVSRNGVGIDNVDMQAARENNVQVLRAEGANARGVAELTLAHMLAAARRLDYLSCALKRREWVRRRGFELRGRTLGVVGFGRIGSEVAQFALALGMAVRAFDPLAESLDPLQGDFAFVSLAELLAESEIVSLHAPPAEDGTPLLDEAALSKLKPGAIIVNTARYELLDSAATLAALETGRISVLTLDAFPTEPPTDWKLPSHDRVIATPHIGGLTVESVERSAEAAVDNLLRALRLN